MLIFSAGWIESVIPSVQFPIVIIMPTIMPTIMTNIMTIIMTIMTSAIMFAMMFVREVLIIPLMVSFWKWIKLCKAEAKFR